jgi:hypothetical protein
MREIIGENLQTFFDNTGITATKTYSGHIGYWPQFEVWEISEEDYDDICIMTEDEYEHFAADGSWWRGADGSNMGMINEEFIINGLPIMAWRNEYRVGEYINDWNDMNEEERDEYEDFEDFLNTWFPKEYAHLTTYFCDELGASTERNVCALATDLAKYNNITMAELFRRYGGLYGDN